MNTPSGGFFVPTDPPPLNQLEQAQGTPVYSQLSLLHLDRHK